MSERVAREILGEEIRAGAGEVVGVQLVRLAAEAADAVHAPVERRLDLIDRALTSRSVGRLAAQPLDLLVDRLLHLADRLPGRAVATIMKLLPRAADAW